jgi:hypothetical protein
MTAIMPMDEPRPRGTVRRHANVLARLRNFQWRQDLYFHQHFCSLFISITRRVKCFVVH